MNPDDDSPRERGRRLRTESATAELELWRHLRAKLLAGFKFGRQHQIDHYFADFCCLQRRLNVELDGGQHAEHAQENQEAARTA